MPAITVAYLAFAAGLLVGFGGEVFLGLVAAAAALVVAVAGQSRAWAIAACGVAVGSLLAGSVVRAEHECAGALAGNRALHVRLTTAAVVGHTAYGRLEGPCDLKVKMAVVAGGGATETLVLGAGRWRQRERALDGDVVRVVPIAGPTATGRLRARAGASLDTLFGVQSALARALVIADERSIDRAVREQFADAGIVHMLSVSGLHVAILGEGVALLALLLRLPVRAVHLTTITLVGIYVLLLGAPSPAVRSAVMLSVTRFAAMRERPTSEWAALALGGFLPLVDLRTVTDIGYQLSVGGMAGLMASGHLAERVLSGRWSPRVQKVAGELLATVVTSLVTMPVIAWSFGRVSLVAPAANLAAAPLFGLAQPALFAALALAAWHPVASVVGDGGQVLLALIGRVASVGASVPGGVVMVTTDLLTTLLLAAAAVALIVACSSHHAGRASAIALACLAFALWRPWLPAGGGRLEVHLIDVGQGDAVAMRTPHGSWVLFDAGGGGTRGTNAGERIVAPYLARRGGKVALFVLSHPHLDHVGGAASVMERLRVSEFWDAARVFGGGAYSDALHMARQRGVRWWRVHPGEERVVDGVRLTILAPDSAWTASRDDPNTSSVVVRAEFGRTSFVFTGDAEAEEERWMVARYAGALKSDVLKVAHHGSATSSTEEWLDAVRPRVALVSVGTGNRYGHPDAEVLRRLNDHGTEVLRTDDAGTMVLESDGTRLWISGATEKRRLVK